MAQILSYAQLWSKWKCRDWSFSNYHLGMWSNCAPKYDPNVVQIVVQLWLKSWSRTYLQMWSNFGPEDSKSPFVVHIVVQYDPNYGLIVAQLWSNHGPNYSPLSKQK